MTKTVNYQNGELTEPQQRILALLEDGKPHAAVDLFDLLDDPAGARVDPKAGKLLISSHISAIRNHISKDAADDRVLICEFFHRRSHYRLMRSLVKGLRHGPSIQR